jgi:hypothetical protein
MHKTFATTQSQKHAAILSSDKEEEVLPVETKATGKEGSSQLYQNKTISILMFNISCRCFGSE